MTQRIGQPIPYPESTYDQIHEEAVRRVIEQNIQDILEDINAAKTFSDAEASLALRRYQFLALASRITTYG